MRLSLVIAAHNEGDCLSRTVASCIETCAGLDYERVVADDASWDGSVEETQARFPRIRVIRHDERKGASPTKDLGASHARGEVLVFLDGHTKPEPGAIQRLVEDVETLNDNAIITPAVAALCTERWKTLKHQIGHGYFVELERFDCGWLPLTRLKKHSHRGKDFYESPALIGCALAIHRELYDDLRGFDPHMRSWGVEDLDFGLKSWLMGHPILHDPRAIVGHRFRKSFDNFSVPVEHLLLNQLRMARKNFTHGVWAEWLEQTRKRHSGKLVDHPEGLWTHAWKLFEETRASVETERSYLMANRVWDEFWYAERFGLRWSRLIKPGEASVYREIQSLAAEGSPSPSPSPEPVTFSLRAVQYDHVGGAADSWRIKLDGENTDFRTPEWLANEYPSPYLYKAGATMKIKLAQWKVYGHQAGNVYKIKGIGEEGINIPETNAIVFEDEGETFLKIENVNATTKFPNDKVRFFNSFRIMWEVSTDGADYEDAGHSLNPIYVCRTGPGGAARLRYRTTVHLACSKEGATDDDQALKNTWSLFETLQVKGWDDTQHQWNRNLYYYKADTTFDQNVHDTARDLFNSPLSTGQCECWMNLLLDACQLNGMSGNRTYAYVKDEQNTWFLVKNWTFNATSNPNPNLWNFLTYNPQERADLIPAPPGKVYGDLVNSSPAGQPELFGQNSYPPSQKVFFFHAFARFSTGGTTKYYDPSYGVIYDDEADFQDKAISGFAEAQNNNPVPWLFFVSKPSPQNVRIKFSPQKP